MVNYRSQIPNMNQPVLLNKAPSPSHVGVPQMQPNFQYSHMVLIRRDAIQPSTQADFLSDFAQIYIW